MPTPEEIEGAAGIEPTDDLARKRIWAAAQAHAATDGRAPSAEDLRIADAMLSAADEAGEEHLADGRGRAVITLTDTVEEGEFEVTIELTPEPEDLSEEEISCTPAQAVALEMVQSAFGDPQDGHYH